MNPLRYSAWIAMTTLTLVNPARAAEPERFYIAIDAGRADLSESRHMLQQDATSSFSVQNVVAGDAGQVLSVRQHRAMHDLLEQFEAPAE